MSDPIDPELEKLISLPQRMAGFIEDHLKWMMEMLADGVTLNAMLADLGLPPPESPVDDPSKDPNVILHFGSIADYRAAADPDAEALRSVLDDIFAIYDSIGSVIEAASDDSDDVKKELAAGLLNLLLLNYLRLRHNGWYKVGQLVTFLPNPFWKKAGPTVARFFDRLPLELLVGNQDSDETRSLDSEEDAKFWSDLGGTVIAGVLAHFANLRNLIYGWDGLDDTQTPVADRISRRTLTIAFDFTKKEGTEEDPSQLTAALNLTSLLVPRSDGGPGIFVTLSGAEEIDAPISKKWRLKFKASANGTLDFMIPFFGLKNAALSGSPDASASARIQSQADGTQPSYVIPRKNGTRLELGKFSFTGEINANGVEFIASAEDGALVLSGEDCDGLTAGSLPTQETRIGFDLGLGISSEKGFYIKGGSGLQTVIPIGKSLGPTTIHQVLLKVAPTTDPKPAKVTFEASTSLSVKLGPVTASIDQIGFQMVFPFERTNGKYDFDIGLKPPNGVGLSIDSAAVTGGGFLRYEPDKEQYSGVVYLKLEGGIEVKALGLIATRLPDHSKGFSLLVIITAEGFQPVPLGLGFELTGIGGLLAINRTFNEEVLREGIKNHTLDSVLFPANPTRDALQLLSNLDKAFPLAKGRHLFGPMVEITWGKPETLITMQLGIVLEFSEPLWPPRLLRLLVIGQLEAILPRRDHDLLRIKMDAVGIIDFDQGTASLDAVLYESRLLKKFVLTGGMAMRLKWKGSPSFALAVGGLHHAFNPPANFPRLDRLAINLSGGDNPRILCEAYFAITSNTVQFGARANLYVSAHGFSIEGDIGFDVLIQLSPFHFLAEFHASIQLKRGSRNLFKVKLEGALEGPRPLRVRGKATFEIFWWDISIKFDKTLVEGERPPPPPAIDVLNELRQALADPRNWEGALPTGARRVVTVRDLKTPDEVTIHPLGKLGVKQKVVPLNLTRDIDKFGSATPSGPRRFTITSVTVGVGELEQQPTPLTLTPLTDFFAPAQFFEMSDDESIASPSFAEMEAGFMVGVDDFAFSNDDGTGRVADGDVVLGVLLEYDTILVDKEAITPEQPKGGYTLDRDRLLYQARFGAAGRSVLRRSGAAKYQNRARTSEVTVARPGFAIASTDDLSAQSISGAGPAKAMNWIDAQQALRELHQQNPAEAKRRQVVPVYELARL